MNQLISVRTNILYTKVGEEYIKLNELVLLVDEPSYKRTNDGEVIRERGVKELRFTVTEKAFEDLILFLTDLKNAGEGDLG